MSIQSKNTTGGTETAGSNPLESLADKGFSPDRPAAGPLSRDPEVVATARRRTFTAAYKLQILRQSDACTMPGERGALLRREGLYGSHLTEWRRARELGALAALEPVQRGPKVQPLDPSAIELKQLRRDLARVQAKLERAELIIDIQKKLRRSWGSPCRAPTSKGKVDSHRHHICPRAGWHQDGLPRARHTAGRLVPASQSCQVSAVAQEIACSPAPGSAGSRTSGRLGYVEFRAIF